MKFNYQARTKTGEIRTGQIEASSKEAALIFLQKYGLYVTFLGEEVSPFYAKKIKLFEGVPAKDIVLFSRQLSIMFKSKVPLIESLKVLSAQVKNPNFQEIILKLSEEVEAGTAFSIALSRYPKVFSSFYISVVKAGEAAGSLSESLNYLAEHLEREYHLTAKVRGALLYPAFILLVVLAVLVLMVFFVIPNLTAVLEASGGELPLPTRFVMGSADFLRNQGLWIILVLFIVGVFCFRYYFTEKGRNFFDRIFLRLPLIGTFLKMVYLSRFAENLSTLISGGLPIIQALEIAAVITGNTSYQKIILQAREEVRKGEQISSVLARAPGLFPPVFVQMALIGEKTGTLDSTLRNIVDFYQKEIDRTIDNLLSILEPVLIVFLGLVVAGVMLSILMPIYKVISL